MISMITTLLLRTTSVIAVVFAVSLLLGKRHVGEMSVFDLIITMTLGDVVGEHITELDSPFSLSLIAVVLIGIVHKVVSAIIIKNRKIARFITYDPTIVIENGAILAENLKTFNFPVDELVSQLRDKDIFDISEVQYAILETKGTLSVLKKPEYLPLTPDDIALSTSPKGLAYPVIIEGDFHYEGMQAIKVNKEWVAKKVNDYGYKQVEDIFLAMVNEQKEIYISPKKVNIETRLDM